MSSVFDGLADVFAGALGQPVTVTPSGGSAREIRAMFVRRVADGSGVVVEQPAIHARSADVADLADGAVVSVGGVSYVARVFRRDARGMTTVILEG